MARDVMTFRLDRKMRLRLKAVVERRRLTPSGAARLALERWLEAEEAAASVNPYEQIKDLVGSVRGGDGRRSSRSTRAIAAALKERHGRKK
jgi:antitoxin component of RelBE/YafQ-DinJ toxin-antitoxin module